MSIKELVENTIMAALLLNRGKLKPDRIHTLIFLLSHDIDKLHKIKFKANTNGVYSYYVNETLMRLFKKRYIKRYKLKIGLTPLGRKKAKEIILRYPYLFTLQSFVKFLKRLDDDEILAILYYVFPKYFENVPKLERIEQNRLELATKLYLKGKVPIDIAARISGYRLTDFIEALRVKNLI